MVTQYQMVHQLPKKRTVPRSRKSRTAYQAPPVSVNAIPTAFMPVIVNLNKTTDVKIVNTCLTLAEKIHRLTFQKGTKISRKTSTHTCYTHTQGTHTSISMKTNDVERKRHYYIGQPNSSKQTQPSSFGSTETLKKHNAIQGTTSMPNLISL